ncbi:high mobility group protein 20A [Anopheles maculipalpis]|uniref:high mobility group protein 20A n=1 Tax=Anopheles maculipalpis TaxID=1496333 RepID=UPI002158ED67|nr:high mobility group protein 20A [Anopheles maculipalpis]
MEKEKTEDSDTKLAPVSASDSIQEQPPTAAAKSDEKTPDPNNPVPSGSGTKGKQSTQKTAKKKRQKPPKDANAPKHPLTGYVRYMNENRDRVRAKHPNLTPIEITKIMAEEWSKLPEDRKKPYLEAAEVDKERYNKEISEYKLNNEAKAKALQNEAQMTQAKEVPEPKVAITSMPYVNGKVEPKVLRQGDYDIPIFTEDFLDHNKVVDSELRTLRKSNIDYEQQNSVLEKHVENMENGIQKLNGETSSLESRNAVLESYLLKLRTTLANALQGLPLSGDCAGATVDNIDQYLENLHQMADSSTQGHTLNKAKDIIRKLDLQNLTL